MQLPVATVVDMVLWFVSDSAPIADLLPLGLGLVCMTVCPEIGQFCRLGANEPKALSSPRESDCVPVEGPGKAHFLLHTLQRELFLKVKIEAIYSSPFVGCNTLPQTRYIILDRPSKTPVSPCPSARYCQSDYNLIADYLAEQVVPLA